MGSSYTYTSDVDDNLLFQENRRYLKTVPCQTSNFREPSSGLPLSYAAPGIFTGQHSLAHQPEFCASCKAKQSIKIKQLNSFESSGKRDFCDEFEEYRALLDLTYGLCPACESVLNSHLANQEKDLRCIMLNNYLQLSKITPLPNKGSNRRESRMSPWTIVLQFSSLLFLTLLLKAEICKCNLLYKENVFTLSIQNLLRRLHDGLEAWLHHWKPGKSIYSPVLFEIVTVICAGYRKWALMQTFILRNPLHLVSISFIIQVVNFVRWQTRLGIVTLVVSFSLGVLLCEADTIQTIGPILALVCWALNLIACIYAALLNYRSSKVVKKKRIRSCRSSTPCSTDSYKQENQFSEDSDDDAEDNLPSYFDHTLNWLSLDMSDSQKVQARTSSPGSYWSGVTIPMSTTLQDSTPSPLVATGERPLIVPATLNLSNGSLCRGGLNQTSHANHQMHDISMESQGEEENEEKGPFQAYPQKDQSPRWSPAGIVCGMLFSLKCLLIISLLCNIALIFLLVKQLRTSDK
ncbi:uncharacterized protein LOC5506499 isoform X2 [Nematostella vectensis]|uniref:uncharacterized protein LOC5506499 isoform X2 n=1 Tax=Nematostella vectensis TaxID=45351 RepID=UPI00138FBF79|nr:uncharacterized protein LOC5506499 isoform X2 [Nematostella vectensis]